MNAKYKQLEEAILKEADLLIEKAKSQGEKALYNLFKSAILKKYRNQYDVDIQMTMVNISRLTSMCMPTASCQTMYIYCYVNVPRALASA